MVIGYLPELFLGISLCQSYFPAKPGLRPGNQARVSAKSFHGVIAAGDYDLRTGITKAHGASHLSPRSIGFANRHMRRCGGPLSPQLPCNYRKSSRPCREGSKGVVSRRKSSCSLLRRGYSLLRPQQYTDRSELNIPSL